MSDPSLYTVGWICAIHTEYVAAQTFLDENHEGPKHVSPNDNNDYTLGRIGEHNVAIAVLPGGEYGLSSAAAVARDMLHSFPNIRIGLMVGIGGGAPSKRHDIRLGDIVVSFAKDEYRGVFQYDFGKAVQDQEFQASNFLNDSPPLLRAAVSGLRAKYETDGHEIEKAIANALKKKPRLSKRYKRPDPATDRLFVSSFVHPQEGETSCTTTCTIEPSNLIIRPEREEYEDNPAVHYGLIASGNTLMKDALIRDKLAEKNVLCFEMEAAGLMNHFPCLIIRGICDYSDSHKNKDWQGYAAMTAAAYAKDILCRIAPNRIESEKRVADLLSGVEKTISKILHKQEDGEYEAILKWLAPTDPAAQHNDYIKRRHPGTGQWFLESMEFQAWLEYEDYNKTLFCPGIPGAGKTILTAVVIDHLQRSFSRESNVGIAYIYCDFRKHSQQNIEELLLSLTMQLLRGRSIPDDIKKLYDDHKNRGTRPLLNEISEALLAAATACSKVFLIIDALDECSTSQMCRTKLLSEVFNLRTKCKAYCFATSRAIPDIEANFIDCRKLAIRAKDTDIQKFLESHLPGLSGAVGDHSDLQDKAKAEIAETANGMFLLAQLRLNSLNGMRSRQAVLNALDKPSTDNNVYNSAYSGAMERIQSQASDSRDCAMSALSWITFAKWQLTISQLQHALAVNTECVETQLNRNNIPEAKYIVSICAGLVTIDNESNSVRLIHSTTQQFFERTWKDWFPNAEAEMTRVCVNYLLYDLFSSGDTRNVDRQSILQENVLYDYAAKNWGHHAHKSGLPGVKPTLDLFESKKNLSACVQIMLKEKEREYLPIPYMNRMHLIAYFGLPESTAATLSNGGDNELEEVDTNGLTALSLAVVNEHARVVKQLLDVGANIHKDPRLLLKAVQIGHEEITLMLIRKGVPINGTGTTHDHRIIGPLQYAVETGDTSIAKILLAHGADPDLNAPLYLACYSGHDAMIELLLDNGAQVDCVGYNGWTPLMYAVYNDFGEMAKTLLDSGANTNFISRGGWSPLTAAALYSRWEILKYLLDKGANPDCKDPDGWTPLSRAVKLEEREIVKLLVTRGADLNLAVTECRTPLAVASSLDDEMAKFLLSLGATPNSTALNEALARGSKPLARLLLLQGATPRSGALELAMLNGSEVLARLIVHKAPELRPRALELAAQDGVESFVRLLLATGTNPSSVSLGQAILGNHTAIVKLLLEAGANAHEVDINGQSCLIQAAKTGNTTIGSMLLKHNVSIAHKDNQNLTALSWAVRHCNQEFVRLLLDQGANIDSQDRNGFTPLSLAVDLQFIFPPLEIALIEFLIQRGANMEIETNESQTPLFLALEKKDRPNVVELLVAKGADTNCRDQENRSPLSFAIFNGLVFEAGLLLRYGADTNHTTEGLEPPLILAIKRKELGLAEQLIEYGADIEATGEKNSTPLSLSVAMGLDAMVQILLSKDANFEHRAYESRTPLAMAAELNRPESAELLLDKGADLEARDLAGRTPLALAALYGRNEMVDLLLKRGAFRYSRDNQGRIPAELARKCRYEDLADQLS